MDEIRYQISEAAKLAQVETHVLRYWEEELSLSINRNEMGHRYYTKKDIQTFWTIKELKKQGMPLKKIRERIQGEKKESRIPKVVVMRTGEKEKSRKERFLEIMDKLLEELEEGEGKEDRFRKLDEAIRQRQQTRRMAAAAEEQVNQRKRRILPLRKKDR